MTALSPAQETPPFTIRQCAVVVRSSLITRNHRSLLTIDLVIINLLNGQRRLSGPLNLTVTHLISTSKRFTFQLPERTEIQSHIQHSTSLSHRHECSLRFLNVKKLHHSPTASLNNRFSSEHHSSLQRELLGHRSLINLDLLDQSPSPTSSPPHVSSPPKLT